MADHFSKQAATYAKYRPDYPEALYEFVLGLVNIPTVGTTWQGVQRNGLVWDCGTGSGQAAIRLAKAFAQVEATDASAKQIENAVQAPNIRYQVLPAEETPFENDSFDLITVAQAIHWFDHDRFYKEAQRLAKPGAILAVWGYAHGSIDPVVDIIYKRYYAEITGPYWPKERGHVDSHYRTLPFPFPEVEVPSFSIRLNWNMEEFLGYLSSWSATQHFINEKKLDPVELIREDLASSWGDPKEKKVIEWPILMKVARID